MLTTYFKSSSDRCHTFFYLFISFKCNSLLQDFFLSMLDICLPNNISIYSNIIYKKLTEKNEKISQWKVHIKEHTKNVTFQHSWRFFVSLKREKTKTSCQCWNVSLYSMLYLMCVPFVWRSFHFSVRVSIFFS